VSRLIVKVGGAVAGESASRILDLMITSNHGLIRPKTAFARWQTRRIMEILNIFASAK